MGWAKLGTMVKRDTLPVKISKKVKPSELKLFTREMKSFSSCLPGIFPVDVITKY